MPSPVRLPVLPAFRNRYLLVADLASVAAAAWLAFALRFTWLFHHTAEREREFLSFLTITLAVKTIAFFGFGLYRRYWRYAGFWDLIAVVLANAAGSLLVAIVVIVNLLMQWGPGLSRSVPPVDFLLTLSFTLGTRASIRALSDVRSQRRRGPRTARKVLIVGAGDAGTAVAREMQRNPQFDLSPVGYLDDDPEKRGKEIYGLPVLGAVADLAHVANVRSVDEVVVAMPYAAGAVVRVVTERCRDLGIPSRVMPGIFELLDGRLSVSRLRRVEITDLLRRPQLNVNAMAPGYIERARVLVTGAGGSIGAELCRQIAAAHPAHLTLVGHGENSVFAIENELRATHPQTSIRAVIVDVRDRARLMQVFERERPQMVFHAAAHKHVTLMENNAPEAITNNVTGTANVVRAATATGVSRFVMVSTDKAAAPSNMMGASKRVAEAVVRQAARATGQPFVVVRFGNVLGSRGSVVPIFRSQIEAGGPVTVTHPEVRRYFMTIPEAVHLVLQAGAIGLGGELFVLDMGVPVLLKDLATDMIRLSGFDEQEIPIVFTGLRPGEKLTEVLWEEGAVVERAACADVWRVHEPSAIDDERLPGLVGALERAAAEDDAAAIARLIGESLPSATVVAQ
jgi:FlaA1/EpsC-like NDP-sugar epimerase